MNYILSIIDEPKFTNESDGIVEGARPRGMLTLNLDVAGPGRVGPGGVLFNFSRGLGWGH